MTRSKNKLKPQIILIIDTSNMYNIPFIIVNSVGKILYMADIPRSGEYYKIRHNIINFVDILVKDYNVDMILFEQNKLFIDKIDKYPDPYVLRNIMLGFGVQITIEDKYYENIMLVALPEYEWKNIILGHKTMYAIDLYKSHILNRTDIPIKFLISIENNNYYKAICLSESVLFDKLMDRKYQINKGD